MTASPSTTYEQPQPLPQAEPTESPSTPPHRDEETIIKGKLQDIKTELIGGFKQALLKGLQSDPLYQRAQDSSKASPFYSISDGILMVTTTMDSHPIYIPEGHFKEGIYSQNISEKSAGNLSSP